MEKEKEWFAEWFDSPYYHILYEKRDTDEAEYFLRNLIAHFKPQQDIKIIDLACGKGRHSIFLNSLGFDVTGVDLSQQSIMAAKGFENEKLHFEVQDLRDLRMSGHFDIALNLFTSFGYFENLESDVHVLKQVHGILKQNGFLLIDFFNAKKILSSLVQTETKNICNIKFEISREVKEGQIIKNIQFTDCNQKHSYQEKVQALSHEDFEYILDKSGFIWVESFGSYGLDPFDADKSDRLIILVKKSDVG